MPSAVHQCDHDNVLTRHAEVNSVREPPDDGAARVGANGREGERIGGDAFDHMVDCVRELNAQFWALLLVSGAR